jgi:hypothetical protein
MSGRAEKALTARERFMQVAQEEMAAFERRELEFQRKDRQERAARLPFPSESNLGSIACS